MSLFALAQIRAPPIADMGCEKEFQELFQIEALLSEVAPRLLGYSSLPEFLAVCCL
jgi:hypothetical protein